MCGDGTGQCAESIGGPDAGVKELSLDSGSDAKSTCPVHMSLPTHLRVFFPFNLSLFIGHLVKNVRIFFF